MNKILLFIPCYNCEKQIVRVLKQLDDKVLEYINEIIVVNNRSIDNTEQVVRDFIKNNSLPLILFRNDENYGLGGSHKIAFNYALDNGFDYVIVLHGDDQGDIHDILPLLQSNEYQSFDCCLGSRFMKKSNLKGYSKLRTSGNRLYNFLFSVATGRKVLDLGSGLNIYKTDMLRRRFYMQFSDDLMFNCYMLLTNSHYNFKSKFFPITWREEDQLSNVKLFSQGLRTFNIAISYLFRSNKGAFIERDFREKKIQEYTATRIK